MTALDDICAYAEEQLDGSGLTFALVAWLPGRQGDPKAVALSGPPQSQPDAPIALLTALRAALPGSADPQPYALCKADGGCVCGGDTARVRAGCSNWKAR